MGITVPPGQNYPSPLVAVPTVWQKDPAEGSKLIACEIDWGTMGPAGGQATCLYFNMQNNTTLNFSQIVALAVDNSNCGCDVEFIFPDTSETLTIPAYSPKTIVPVFTNQCQFWAYAPNAQAEDVTRFSIHNDLPPPIAVPTTAEQNFGVFNNINVASSSNSQLLAATISGTLEALTVNFVAAADGTVSTFTWQIQDGNNNVIAGGQVRYSGVAINAPQLALTDVRIRFQNGLKLVWTNSGNVGAAAVLPINLYYRTP